MENRDRDRVSGEVNRNKSSKIGEDKGESNADFGQNIGRSEDLENEPSRRSGISDESGMQGSKGRSGSSDVGSSSSGGLQGDH